MVRSPGQQGQTRVRGLENLPEEEGGEEEEEEEEEEEVRFLRIPPYFH